MSYLNYVQEKQGVYATYAFVMEMINSSMTISRPMIMNGCEEVARLAMKEPDNEKLIAHVVAFLETFNIDSKNLRSLIQLLRLKSNAEMKGFEKFLNTRITVSSSEEDLKLVEALEVFWRVKKYPNPTRSYLRPLLEADDWFRFVLLAQYFNYSLEDFISICERKVENKVLCDNLIRAVSFDVPEAKRHCSFSRRRQSKEIGGGENQEVFKGGKFLNSKHDLFAILLKCSENVSRVELPFEEFQKYFRKDALDNNIDDLLYQAKKHDWPLIAVLAGTTSLYRIKYCWITWLMLSSDFKLSKKFESIEELTKSVFEHCLLENFIRTLDESVDIFYPNSALKIFTKFLRHTKNGNFNDMESLLKLFIVKLSEADFKMIVLKGNESYEI